MRGTFRDGDTLWIQPAVFSDLQPGDVVAMESGGTAVAHRLLARTAGGGHTRGDGALHRDGGILAPDRLIGKVMMCERRGCRFPVLGGTAGLRRAMALHTWSGLRRCLLMLLAPAYRRLRARRWVAKVWMPGVQRVRFVHSGGGLIKYIHGGRTVACWVPGERLWTCRKPYDLVLEPPVS